jgi:hypothetical protein
MLEGLLTERFPTGRGLYRVFGAIAGFSASSLVNYNFGDAEVLLLLLFVFALSLVAGKQEKLPSGHLVLQPAPFEMPTASECVRLVAAFDLVGAVMEKNRASKPESQVTQSAATSRFPY